MAQFSYVGSLDGNSQPVLRRFVIKGSIKLSIGDAVKPSDSGVGNGIMLATAGAGAQVLGFVHGFCYGDGKSLTPTAGNAHVTNITPGASNDAAAYGSPTSVYALVDINPNSIYRGTVDSGTLAVTAGALGTSGGGYCNLGTVTSGAQTIHITGTTAIGQLLNLGPNPAAPTTDLDVCIVQTTKGGVA